MIKLLQPGLARLGKIVIGEKGKSQQTKEGKSVLLPTKLDYFLVKTLQRDTDGRLIPDAALMERLGERPVSLKIRLPFNDVDMNFQTELRYYRSRTLFCHGDGEQAQRLTMLTDTRQQAVYGPAKSFGPCGEACIDFQERRCKPLGILRVILEEQQQVGGVYEWRTTSWNSIRNVLSGLATIKAQTGGILAWIPLTMRLVPQTVQPKDGAGANTAYVVQIVYEGSPQQLLTTVRDLLAWRAPLMEEIRELETSMRALPPVIEEPDEQADIQEEFYPDLADAAPPGEIEPQERQTRHQASMRAQTTGEGKAFLLEQLKPWAGDREALTRAFGTRIWAKIERMSLEELQAGYGKLMPQEMNAEATNRSEDIAEAAVDAEVSTTGNDGSETAMQEDAATCASPEQLQDLHDYAAQHEVGALLRDNLKPYIKDGTPRVPPSVYATVKRNLEYRVAQKSRGKAQPEPMPEEPKAEAPLLEG